MEEREIFLLAQKVRKSFEKDESSRSKLEKLYLGYNPIKDIEIFIQKALEAFPKGNCGLTSVYLRQFLPEAKIVRGHYKEQPHTFLVLQGNTVVDITADQFGGPEVYVGSFCDPWKR